MNVFLKILAISILFLAVFTTASLVPTSATAEQQINNTYQIDKILVRKDGKLLSISLKDFISLKLIKSTWIKNVEVEYIHSTNGSHYTLKDFITYKTAYKSSKTNEVLDKLNGKSELVKEVTINGTVSIDTDGKIVVNSLRILAVRVIESNKIELSFSQAAESISVKMNGNDSTGFSVQLSEDKTKATITTSAILNGNYTINYKGDTILELVTDDQTIEISIK